MRGFAAASVLLLSAGLALLAPTFAHSASSDDGSEQPYIDSLIQKKHIKVDRKEPNLAPGPTPTPTSPSQAAPSKVPSSDPNEVQPYIQKLLNDGRSSGVDKTTPESTAATPQGKEAQPYLEAIKEKKDLQPAFKGKVNQAAGFSVVAANTFNITSTEVQANPFNQVYNPQNKYAPSGDIFYERQLYRNEHIGAFGLIGHLNVITITGKGIFTKLQTTSQTNFRFNALPFTIGGEYRFLQLHFVQPYVQLGAVGIPYFETRDDSFPSRRGISRGYNAIGGVALNLDWISRSAAWAQYEDSSVLHTYLILQMEFLRPIAGAVSFNYTGLYAGLMFEF